MKIVSIVYENFVHCTCYDPQKNRTRQYFCMNCNSYARFFKFRQFFFTFQSSSFGTIWRSVPGSYICHFSLGVVFDFEVGRKVIFFYGGVLLSFGVGFRIVVVNSWLWSWKSQTRRKVCKSAKLHWHHNFGQSWGRSWGWSWCQSWGKSRHLKKYLELLGHLNFSMVTTHRPLTDQVSGIELPGQQTTKKSQFWCVVNFY